MDFLRGIINDPRTERFIMALIILNAITLGLETSQTVMAQWDTVLHLIDQVILGIFVIELTGRIIVHRLSFFRDPWSLFDFLVVGIALLPATDAFSVLRALRVLRVLRLITVLPSLRRVVGGLIASLPGMGSIVMLLAVLYYVFSVMATQLFGATFPEWFGSIGASAYSLFQIMTLESWSMGIVRPVMEKFPYAWAFFVPYIIVTTFAALNLFIGVVVNAMQSEHADAEAAEHEAEREMVHDETEPLMAEMKLMRAELTSLRAELAERLPKPA
ncbi:MAG: ion transporter [Rhizobiales bacterium]|nr:ion transporter [Hyphomicrobiales bacterium]